MKLPKAEQNLEERLTATEALLMAAEARGTNTEPWERRCDVVARERILPR
jgi:hypothetical protein